MAVETQRVSLHDMADGLSASRRATGTFPGALLRAEPSIGTRSSTRWINLQDHMRWCKGPVASATADPRRA